MAQSFKTTNQVVTVIIIQCDVEFILIHHVPLNEVRFGLSDCCNILLAVNSIK